MYITFSVTRILSFFKNSEMRWKTNKKYRPTPTSLCFSIKKKSVFQFKKRHKIFKMSETSLFFKRITSSTWSLVFDKSVFPDEKYFKVSWMFHLLNWAPMVLRKSWHHKELHQCSCGAPHNDTRKSADLGCPLASLTRCKRQRQRRDRTTDARVLH